MHSVIRQLQMDILEEGDRSVLQKAQPQEPECTSFGRSCASPGSQGTCCHTNLFSFGECHAVWNINNGFGAVYSLT